MSKCKISLKNTALDELFGHSNIYMESPRTKQPEACNSFLPQNNPNPLDMSQAGSELLKLHSSQGRSALCHSFQQKREGGTSQWAEAGSHQGYFFSQGRGTWVIAVDKWLLCFPIFSFPHWSFKLPSVSFYSATAHRVHVCVCERGGQDFSEPQVAASRPQEGSLLIGQSPNLKLETATRWAIRLNPSGVGQVCPMLFVG